MIFHRDESAMTSDKEWLKVLKPVIICVKKELVITKHYTVLNLAACISRVYYFQAGGEIEQARKRDAELCLSFVQ